MKRLFFYIRLYFLMVGQYIKTRLQYRFDFFISTFGMILLNLSGLLSLWLLLSNLKSLAGWSFEELVFIYSFSTLAQLPLQIMFDNVWQLRNHVNQGTFIKYYFKPINSLFYYISEVVDLKGFGQLVYGIIIFIWSSKALAIQWTLERIVLLPLLLLSSALVIISLMLIAASASFWVKDSFSILSFVSSFRDYGRYPINIYNSVFRFIFTWIIPIGFVAFYPCQFFVRDLRPDWIAWLTPLMGAVLFWLATRIWNRGTRAWGGTGS